MNAEKFDREVARRAARALCIDSEALYDPKPDDDEIEEEDDEDETD